MGIKMILNRLTIKLILFICLILLSTSSIATVKEEILILRAAGEKFFETAAGIKDDLGDDFKFTETVFEPKLMPQAAINNIKQYILNIKPRLIVLIGNNPVRLYTSYQKQNPNQIFPPSIVMSALYVDRLIQQMQNTQGIRHEIPAVTSISNIRSLVKQPIKRVGVLYRRWMQNYIQLNTIFCKKEGIELIAVEMPNNFSVKNLNYQLKHLLNKNIDALWVVNDNAIISSQLIQNVWLPNIKEFNKPVIVGVEALTSTSLDFGTFSAVPDQYALGIQGAGLIGDIIDEGIEQLQSNKVYEPLSVKKLLNIQLMQKRNIAINESKLETLDKLIR
jgi:hypothetical protein